MNRPSKDQWAMNMVEVVAQRSTCVRRKAGCVLVDVRGHILATGYNGVASGLPHCMEGEDWTNIGMCPGRAAPSGDNLDGCSAIHAEQNALLQCGDVHRIVTAYVSASPCMTCTKLLMNTSCERIVFEVPYPQPSARDLWEFAGRKWTRFGE